MQSGKQLISGVGLAGMMALCSSAALAQGSYPAAAAGWGPALGNGRMASRWAEDWRAQRAAGQAPQWKAMPLGGGAALTLSGELRLRADAHRRTQLSGANHYNQGLLRAVAGADLRLNQHMRVYAEAGTAQVVGRRDTAAANQQNTLSLQQGFLDLHSHITGIRVGLMAGRQEFGDGPRQLISIGDGANLRRTWNGVRGYALGERWRVGLFSLHGTRLGRESIDEKVNHGETLRGASAGFMLAGGPARSAFLEPFWYRTDHAATRLAGRTGRDQRDTRGVRLWGRTGRLGVDWTIAHQRGRSHGRDASAWAVFTMHSYALSGDGWKPRLGVRLDAASGGGSYGSGPTRAFNPLYATSNYIGEGQYLGVSNLIMLTPGITVSPLPQASLSFDLGIARRLKEGDAVYGAALRPYPGTEALAGDAIGSVMRLSASWSANHATTVFVNLEHMRRGDLLKRAGVRSGSYVYLGATIRY